MHKHIYHGLPSNRTNRKTAINMSGFIREISLCIHRDANYQCELTNRKHGGKTLMPCPETCVLLVQSPSF